MWDTAPWDGPRPVAARDQSRPYHCPSYKLPANGVIELSPGNLITLGADAYFRPLCVNAQHKSLQDDTTDSTGGVTSIADIRDPFHASITPQAYATGAATVIAWMLVIMLIITPRTFFVGNATGRSGLMGRRGLISGATGGGSIIGVGSRPWLQKVAALTVAISLTLATTDTFKIASTQYREGFIDAMELRNQVVAGKEIKVSRIISDIFLWLAQVQTLIRLFPRHKEKVIIKWVGFALILLDITFSCLNSFGPYDNSRQPAHFDTAIPALSYLFQLSLSMLYAAWVMYYAITKRRYAFYHSMMWNMSVIALLSMIAILTPVVFFITDIANYSIAGWGDYFRWVGAAAASVIVWEWVERIEALEREEKKDGILGREIYDGDDMLDTTPTSSNSVWPSKRRHTTEKDKKKGGDGGRGGFSAFALTHTGRANEFAQRLGRRITESPGAQTRQKRTFHIPAPQPARQRLDSTSRPNRSSRTYQRMSSAQSIPAIPSPVSRTETASADSTVYTIRYHTTGGSPLHQQAEAPESQVDHATARLPDQANVDTNVHKSDMEDVEKGHEILQEPVTVRNKWNWQAVVNPFRRQGRTPPEELQRGRVIEPLTVDDPVDTLPPRTYTGLALADRLGTFAAQQGERFRGKKRAEQLGEAALPVTIIPAQPRGQTWSPELILQQQQPQQDQEPVGFGIQLARIPSTAREERMPSSPQPGGMSDFSEGAPVPTLASSSSRNPLIHRAPSPETDGGQQAGDDGSTSPQADMLGTPMRDTYSTRPAPGGPSERSNHER